MFEDLLQIYRQSFLLAECVVFFRKMLNKKTKKHGI